MSLASLIRGRTHMPAVAVPAVVPPLEAETTDDLVDSGNLAAVKLSGTVIGDVWLVADEDALSENADILQAGLPVFFFEEIGRLRDKTPEALRAIGIAKATFPTARVLQ